MSPRNTLTISLFICVSVRALICRRQPIIIKSTMTHTLNVTRGAKLNEPIDIASWSLRLSKFHPSQSLHPSFLLTNSKLSPQLAFLYMRLRAGGVLPCD